jgi:HPt (histidine-containing phosphotransfer) domain-containing protein
MQLSMNARSDDAAGSPIDRECLAEMWEDAGPALFRRMAELFERERDNHVARLRAALHADDRIGLAFEAHGLKSAAAYVCAEALRAAAARLERQAECAEPVELTDLVTLIAMQADLAGAALGEAIARQSSVS